MISSVLSQTLRISVLLSCIRSMRYAGASEIRTQRKKTFSLLWDIETITCVSLISRRGNGGMWWYCGPLLCFDVMTETGDRCPAAGGTTVCISCDEVNTFLLQRCLHKMLLFYSSRRKKNINRPDRGHICNLTQTANADHNCAQLQAAKNAQRVKNNCIEGLKRLQWRSNWGQTARRDKYSTVLGVNIWTNGPDTHTKEECKYSNSGERNIQPV